MQTLIATMLAATAMLMTVAARMRARHAESKADEALRRVAVLEESHNR